MQKILLLGGSAQQVIAIETAKNMGCYTVLCDYLPDNPGQYIADKYFNASTTDVEAVYEIAKKENVDGILAYASDPAALPAAIVAAKLGLPTNPPKSVEILGVKHKWRKFLQDNGFACPQNFIFSADMRMEEIVKKAQALVCPIVIKPTDSSGSKGVTVLNNFNDSKQVLNSIQSANEYSRNGILIAEEYISRGFTNVIGGDIFVWNGKIVLYGEMSCLRDAENNPLIPIGEKMPSGLNAGQIKAVHTELQKVIDLLGIRFGEMNIEIILDRSNRVHFLELGPRAGGNMIPVQLGDIFNVDLIKANVQAAIGVEPDIVKSDIKAAEGCYMHYVLHSYKEGVYSGLYVDSSVSKNVYRQVIYKKEGERVEVFDGAGKAVGIIFLRFDREEQMERFCSDHNKLISVILKH